MLVPRRNLLAYPNGARPGIDFSNPLLTNGQLRFSFIAGQGSSTAAGSVPAPGYQLFPVFKRAVTTSYCLTVVGSSIDGVIGPSVNTTISTAGSLAFPNNTTVADASVTIAAILRMGSSVSALQFISGDITGTGTTVGLEISAAGAIQAGTAFGTISSSGITAVANKPYFIAVSMRTGLWRWAIRELDTGKIFLATAATAIAMPTPAGTFTLLGSGNNANAFGGRLATYMYASGLNSTTELLAAAQDPWKPWYPNKDQVFFSGSGDILFPQVWL